MKEVFQIRAGEVILIVALFTHTHTQLGFGGYPVVIKMFADSKDSKADPLILSFYR